MKRFWFGIALIGLTTVAAIGWGVWLLKQREQHLRVAEARVRAALEANRRVRTDVRALQIAPPAAKVGTGGEAASTPVPAAAPLAPTTNRSRAQQSMDRLRSMPEYAAFDRRDMRRQTIRRYGELFPELALSPARLEAFKQLIDQRLTTSRDIYELCARDGLELGGPEYARLESENEERAARRIREFLGDADYAKYTDFEKTAGWRTNLQFELDEFIADRAITPLSDEQKRSLRAAYLESRKATPDAALANANVMTKKRWQDQKLLELAAASLNESQRRTLADYLEFVNSRSETVGRLHYPDRAPGTYLISISASRP